MAADQPGELSRRLGARLKDMILDGRWPAGKRLPSSRELARDMAVSRDTAARALRQLADAGLIEIHPRRGAIVAARVARPDAPSPPPPAPPAPRRPLALKGLAEELFQPALWRRCLASTPPNDATEPALRQAIADMLAAHRGVHVPAEQIFLTTGTAHAVRLALDALGVAGPPMVVDDASPETLPADGVGLVHPAAHPVTCAALAEPARQALLAWAGPPVRVLVEIDRDWDLVAAGTARPAPLRARSGDVVHIGSFNRLLFPGLRVGWLAVPDWLAERLRGTPAEPLFGRPLLATLHGFVAGGSLAIHLRQRLAGWRERRDWLLGRLSAAELFAPGANDRGPHLVLEPLAGDALAMAETFARAGLAATALRSLPGRADGPDRLLIGLTGTGRDARAALEPRLEEALAACASLRH